MTKEDILKRQVALIADLVAKQSVANNWVENWKLQQRIDAVGENIREIRDTKPGERISVLSFKD